MVELAQVGMEGLLVQLLHVGERGVRWIYMYNCPNRSLSPCSISQIEQIFDILRKVADLENIWKKENKKKNQNFENVRPDAIRDWREVALSPINICAQPADMRKILDE